MESNHMGEKEPMRGLSEKASLPDPREDTTVPDLAGLLARAAPDNPEMRAFVAGWFAHARNPDRLVVEDAWRACRQRLLPPGKSE